MKILKTIQLTTTRVILVISTLEDVVNEIDRLSGGKFKPDIDKWIASQSLVKWDYNARKRFYDLRDLHIAQARINVGENDLYNREEYTPTPISVGKHLVSIGDIETIGGPLCEYVHYCYLEVPEGTKQITVKGQTVSIDLNVNQVSRAIKVNQIGYLPDAPSKVGYVGAHIYGSGPLIINSTEFEVVNELTNKVVFKGPIVLTDQNTQLTNGKYVTGEYVYALDFTQLQEIGNFFIRIPNVGKSWTFKHSPDVYGEVFYTSMRGLYHQRCGIELKKPYTNWPRIKCHTKPVCESNFVSFPAHFLDRPKDYERFDVYGATIDTSTTNAMGFGGHHDAADWDRNTQHYTVIFDLLYAFELNPQKFLSNQLNIPESNDNIPDILNEADYSLSVWRRSMNKAGGISGMIETDTHPTIEVDGKYAYSVRTRWDSLLFAAAAAMLAELYKPYDLAKSKTWEYYASRAYNFGNNPENSLGTIKIPARTNRGTGTYYEYTFTETEEHIKPFLAHAKARMFKLTGNQEYLKDLNTIIPTLKAPFKYPYSNKDYSPWINFSLLEHIPEVTADPKLNKKAYIKKWFIDYADLAVKNSLTMPYGCSWPIAKDFWLEWGASNVCNENKALLLAYHLTSDIKYKKVALANCDFMFGSNPMGMSWTTGIGQVYPVVLQHDVSFKDGIFEPVPGITLYGITGGIFTELRTKVWQSPSPNGTVTFCDNPTPVWRRWSAHPTLNTGQCEFTIQETMSSISFSAAMLLSENWRPTDALKTRKPKPKEQLHGLYYLP